MRAAVPPGFSSAFDRQEGPPEFLCDLLLIQSLNGVHQCRTRTAQIQGRPSEHRATLCGGVLVAGQLLEEGQAARTLQAKDFKDRGSHLFGRVRGQSAEGLGGRRSLPVSREA